MKKQIIIREKTHNRLKKYCRENSLFIEGLADKIINDGLDKLEGESK